MKIFQRPAYRFLSIALVIPALCAVSFFLIATVLRYLPDPIGPRAEIFEDGARLTLLLTLASGSIGLLLGAVTAISKLSSWRLLRYVADVYIWVFRGTPLLTQILFVYYAFPILLPFLRLDEFSASLVALSLNVGAYNAEAIRAGVLAVPHGQFEAARSLGFSRFQILRLITLPQALPIMAPPLVNNLIALLKDSAMASVIGLLELTLAGNRISSETFQPVPVLATIAVIYLFLTTIVATISQLVMFGVTRMDWFSSGDRR